jgi:hypothetical protein
MKSIFDPSFRYVPSFETDVRKTFARIRRERAENALETRASLDAAPMKVLPIRVRQEARK